MNLSGKTLLVTGAAGGLGKSLVEEAMAQNAHKIYCCARNTAPLEELQGKYPGIVLCTLDITDTAQLKKLSSSLETIDILINNAGVNSGMRIFDDSRIDFDVNLFGTLNVCRELRHRIAPGGAIINVTSILALINLPVMGLYSASKSALHSATQAMRAELALSDIDVYEVLPGPIDTEMSAGQEMEKASPADVARAIIEGYRAHTYEIYPDSFATMIKETLAENPAMLESNFAQSVG